MFQNIITKTNRFIKLNNSQVLYKCSSVSSKDVSELSPSSAPTTSTKVSGFAQAFEKFSEPAAAAAASNPPTTFTDPQKSFATLLRNSKLIDLGDPEGKVVVGRIFHIVENDLYIDFGWKFHCVCPRPTQNSEQYTRGATVRLRLKQLELSTRFLGSAKDLTILEADAILLGLVDKK